MELVSLFQECKPYLIMTTLGGLCPAIFMVLIHSLLSKGINALVLVVYEQAIATAGLFTFAFFFEKGKRPPLTFQILCYSCLLGFLQITLCQMMLTLSLRFIGVTYQSIAMNMNTVAVFTLALVFRVETLRFWSMSGQAKLWGVVVSAGGAMVMVLWNGPAVLTSDPSASQDMSTTIGTIMLAVAVLSASLWNILVGHVISKYPAELSLSAMMSFFGSIQATIITSFLVTKESWELKWEGGLVLFVILYGGIGMTGLLAYAQTWCIHTKGSFFTSAFSPLVIVFSFILETLVLKNPPHLGSIIGAVLVVSGLYMVLWGKANDSKREEMVCKGSINEPLI